MKAQSVHLPHSSCPHPVTLDACIQGIFPAINAASDLNKCCMLSSVKEATIWTTLQSKPQSTYWATCNVSRAGKKSYNGCITVAPAEHDSPVVFMSSVVATEIQSVRSEMNSKPSITCQKLVKYLHPVFMTSPNIARICCSAVSDTSIADVLALYSRACYIFTKAILDHKPEAAAQLLAEVHELIKAGIFVPPSPISVYPVSQVDDAFCMIQMGKHMGKLVLSYSNSDVIKVKNRPRWRCHYYLTDGNRSHHLWYRKLH